MTTIRRLSTRLRPDAQVRFSGYLVQVHPGRVDVQLILPAHFWSATNLSAAQKAALEQRVNRVVLTSHVLVFMLIALGVFALFIVPDFADQLEAGSPGAWLLACVVWIVLTSTLITAIFFIRHRVIESVLCTARRLGSAQPYRLGFILIEMIKRYTEIKSAKVLMIWIAVALLFSAYDTIVYVLLIPARSIPMLSVTIVFWLATLPAKIADIAYHNKAVIYDILFKASAETMITIAADPKHLGARIGVLSVLHTWGSALTHHPHVQMIVPGGGISLDGTRWVACRSNFLLYVGVLSRLFRRLALEKLDAAYRKGELQFFGKHASLTNARTFAAYLAPLRNSEWVVYCKRPFGGPRKCCATLRASNWGHGAAPIILSATNMRSISRSVQRTIAQLAWLRGREGSFVCGGTQLCRINVVNFWDSPLAQSQCLRPPA